MNPPRLNPPLPPPLCTHSLVHDAKRHNPGQLIPPGPDGEMITVQHDDVRTLVLVRAVDADVVEERHLPEMPEPDEVHEVGHDEL